MTQSGKSKAYLAVILLFLALLPSQLFAQLVINEITQGTGGTKEYAELVVVGTRTCSDSCADIRGWIIDDNNGWLGAGTGQGIATGCMRFSNDANWSCVPYGSIILVYNDGDKNTEITQADDPTDSDHDHVYIVPASSVYMERNGSSPVSPSIPNYVYPTTGFTAGGNWSSLGLSNTGDAVILTAPTNLAAAYHSVGFGSIGNGAAASVYLGTGGAGKVYYLTTSQYNNVADWGTGNAPGDETPGVANGPANASWINSMLIPVNAVTIGNINACITNGGSYWFNNQNLTTAGLYKDTLVSAAGCDSILQLHLSVSFPTTVDSTITSCTTVTYQGNPYNTSTNVRDTINGYMGCDSVYKVVHIVIQNTTAATINDTITGCNKITFNGTDYFATTVVTNTYSSVLGCDSLYKNTALIINNITPTNINSTVEGCGSITVNNNTYYSSTTISDTLLSAYGCDSAYRNLSVNVLPIDSIHIFPADTAICLGKTVTLTATGNNHITWIGWGINPVIKVTPSATMSYQAFAISKNGCPDTATATITVEQLALSLSVTPEKTFIEGDQFTLLTDANFPYQVTAWYPQYLFPHQGYASQLRTADETRTYVVTAKTLAAGCKDTARIIIPVSGNSNTLMPNAFTPNGDGLNDFILPLSNKQFTIQKFVIFNRWGNEVYNYANGDVRGWDGYYKGAPVDQGVYIYTLSIAFSDGSIMDKNGNISVLRSSR